MKIQNLISDKPFDKYFNMSSAEKFSHYAICKR